jgi:hypothetical protein
MGFVNTFTASGQGSLSLGGVQTVNEVALVVQTFATEARTAGATPVRRVWKQCFVALGILATGGPTSGIFFPRWWKYLEVESESNIFPPTALIEADTIYWDVPDGGVMYVEVDWP